jgi:nucleoside-diphosphate-sugar epimerase
MGSQVNCSAITVGCNPARIITSEGLWEITGTTYLGDNSKAKRELGYNPRPLSEGWSETVRHEMKLLGMR